MCWARCAHSRFVPIPVIGPLPPASFHSGLTSWLLPLGPAARRGQPRSERDRRTRPPTPWRAYPFQTGRIPAYAAPAIGRVWVGISAESRGLLQRAHLTNSGYCNFSVTATGSL